MKDAVLFAHAMTGGDKTCALYGKGKKKGYGLLQKDPHLRSAIVNIFTCPSSSHEEVSNIGEKFVRELYARGESFESVDDLRWHLYNRSIARQPVSGSFELATLPPTKAALHQHS